jgi:tetratricopeptide (TPR) repeat protein
VKTALLLAGALLGAQTADRLHGEAMRLLREGKAKEAEAKALETLSQSRRFVAEEEIGKRPERGLLFEEMILEARRSYRARRAGYFRTLGDALSAQEKWAPARKAYRRSLGIEAAPDLYAIMSRHPDLDLQAKLDLLLEAYLAPGSDRGALEVELLATGAYLDRHALKAGLDRKRFGKLSESYPDLELLDRAFPQFQASADGGPLVVSQLFQQGIDLVVYFPVAGCGRCSEELDGIAAPIRDARGKRRLIEVAAFVPESDLPVARRISRLLSLPVRVARTDFVPASAGALPAGEIRVVARGGMTQIRIPMESGPASAEIRARVQSILAFLDAPGLPTEERPELASIPVVSLSRETDDRRAFAEWVATLEKLEKGPAPLDVLHDQLNRLAPRIVPSGREETIAFLTTLSRLEGAHAAKSHFLGLLWDRVGERLLESAKGLDPSIRRTPTGDEGAFFLAVDGNRLLIQRSFAGEGGLSHVDFVLEDESGSPAIRFATREENEPRGVAALQNGAAFFFDSGARLWSGGQVVFEGGPVSVLDGSLVQLRSAIVDTPKADGPLFFDRAGSAEETPLERGLRLFQQGDFGGALLAFGEAEKAIDPVAPYDASDLAYDRARALHEQGKRQEALALFRSIGDVTYQALVDEKARLIESGR